jgi:hypothetical protein
VQTLSNWRALSGFGIGLLLGLLPVESARAQWTRLEAPTFDVVSQLDAAETTVWAGEFDGFIETLRQVYGLEARKLKPLTVVLFARDRAFAPFRPHTESGRANRVDGVFGLRPGWAVIGLGKDRGSDSTRRLIQHEATHWFLSGASRDYPLWFDEGYAQVLSTFETRDGKGYYGKTIPGYASYLTQRGLQPLESFFRVDQDTALHHDLRFYPQAWAFVHYALFSDEIGPADHISEFLRLLRTTSTRAAFETAFDKTFDEMDRDLARYLRGGKYRIPVVDLPDRAGEFGISKPTEALVELTLGRLALVGGNLEAAEGYARALISRAADAHDGYGLSALVQFAAGDLAAASLDAAKSIALGSDDGGVYLVDAAMHFQQYFDEHAYLDEALNPTTSRAITDRVGRAYGLGVTDPQGFVWLTFALLSLPTMSEADLDLLRGYAALQPRDGRPLLVQAAHAYRRGEVDAARELLRHAVTAPYELPSGMTFAASQMAERWLHDEVADILASAVSPADLDVLDAILAAEMSAPGTSAQLANSLQELSVRSRSHRRHLEAVQAVAGGRFERARELWQETLDDPGAPTASRRAAERALERLAQFEARDTTH